ncbi:MAG TPA: FtsX-like permease family protein [Terriglobales bacterium]|nr:FtsX-like permease family protein [Terriglobales bacterium]
MLYDLRSAFRQLYKSPGFTLITVTVLAMGLGANIAVFTVLNGILLRPLLYAVVITIWALVSLNVASLVLARAIAQSHQRAVRSALGADRWQLLQQSVVESLLLSVASVIFGVLFGQCAIKILEYQIHPHLPLTSAIHLDWRVAACFTALTLITAALVGLVPALRMLNRKEMTNLYGMASIPTGF